MQVGVVVIGRNEACRLRDCLESLPSGPPIIYVDSGSSDGSPGITESMGIWTLQLTEGRFSAARGRQAGFDAIIERYSGLEYVQFIDGDCQIAAGWLAAGAAFLEQHVDYAVVVGHLRERHVDTSMLARLIDVDWDLPTGDTDAVGGILMIRAEALRQVGGWRIELIAGEELDLAARLRSAGWRLHRLPDEMATHDMAIRTPGELWRRSVRSGFAYAQLAELHGWRRCPRWLRRAIGNVLYGVVLPVLLLLLSFIWWPGALMIAALYLCLVLRVSAGLYCHGQRMLFSLAYGVYVLGLKVPGALGTFRYVAGRLCGRQARLMEYRRKPVIEV